MSAANQVWVFYDSLTKTQSDAISTENAQLAIFKMRHQDTQRFFIWTVGWEKWQPLKAYLESKQTNFVSSYNNFTSQEDTIAANQEAEHTVKSVVRDLLKMTPVQTSFSENNTNTGVRHNTVTNAYSDISLDENTMAKDDFKIEGNSFDGDDLTFSGTKKPKLDFTKLNVKNALSNRADRHDLKIEILLISAKGKTFRSKSKNISLTGSLLEDSIPFDYCEIVFDAVVINNKPNVDAKFQRVSLRAKTVGHGLTQRIYFIDVTSQQKVALQNLLKHYLEKKGKSKKAA